MIRPVYITPNPFFKAICYFLRPLQRCLFIVLGLLSGVCFLLFQDLLKVLVLMVKAFLNRKLPLREHVFVKAP